MENQKSFWDSIRKIDSAQHEMVNLIFSTIPAGSRLVFDNTIPDGNLNYSHIEGANIFSQSLEIPFDYPVKYLFSNTLISIAIAIADKKYSIVPAV